MTENKYEGFEDVNANEVGGFDDGELGWDDEIENDSPDFVLLEPGDYDFIVHDFERGRYESGPGRKLPPCNMATVHIKIETEKGVTIIPHRLYLHRQTEGMLCAFFAGIGQRQKGEKLKMDWSTVVGSRGRAKIGTRKGTGNYEGNIYNEIKKFYEYEPKKSLTEGGF